MTRSPAETVVATRVVTVADRATTRAATPESADAHGAAHEQHHAERHEEPRAVAAGRPDGTRCPPRVDPFGTPRGLLAGRVGQLLHSLQHAAVEVVGAEGWEHPLVEDASSACVGEHAFESIANADVGLPERR